MGPAAAPRGVADADTHADTGDQDDAEKSGRGLARPTEVDQGPRAHDLGAPSTPPPAQNSPQPRLDGVADPGVKDTGETSRYDLYDNPRFSAGLGASRGRASEVSPPASPMSVGTPGKRHIPAQPSVPPYALRYRPCYLGFYF